jgi:diketogulonate reductase-like aldo/keto reductase
MRYETLHNLLIPKVGFGTWRIGGENFADASADPASLAALRSAIELGYTHFDTAEMYAGGHSEELVGQAVRESGLPRTSLFITSKVWMSHLGYADVLRSCEASLRRLKLEYLDLYLIHWPAPLMNLAETFRALNQLVREGKVKHLGVSNFNLKQLKTSVQHSETPLLTNQCSYCMPDDTVVKNGVLAYCQQNDILLTAYSPLKHRYVAGNKDLKAVAAARGATPQQIALAWLTTQPRVITIPQSFNPQHQRENLEAADIVLTAEEMELLRRK